MRPTASHPATSSSPEPPPLDVPATTAVPVGEGELVRALVGTADAVRVGAGVAVCAAEEVAVGNGVGDEVGSGVALGAGVGVVDGAGEAEPPDAGAQAREPSTPGAAAQTCRPASQLLPSSAVRDSEVSTNG